MHISIYGYTDKRLIIMALIKILQNTGELLLVTDNYHYMRYTEDKTLRGSYLNTTILITTETPDEISANEDIDLRTYTHCLYDLRDNVFMESDLSIYVAPICLDSDEQNLMESLDVGDKKMIPIYLKYPGMTITGPIVPKKVQNVKKLRNKINGTELTSIDEVTVPESLPAHLFVTSKNTILMDFKYLAELEIAEATRNQPEFKIGNLASVLAETIGGELGYNSSQIQRMLAEGGKL